MRNFIKKYKIYITGLLVGAANGLFGSGGGMIAVPMLEACGIEEKKSHASSIAVTLALSVISTVVYFAKGSIDISDAMKYVPCGLIGAAAGAKLLKKIPDKGLHIIFGGIMIFAGARILLGG